MKGKHLSSVFVNAKEGHIKSLQGSPIYFVFYKGSKILRLNHYVTVIKADIQTQNGSVAHVIDQVLIPENVKQLIEKKVLGK